MPRAQDLLELTVGRPDNRPQDGWNGLPRDRSSMYACRRMAAVQAPAIPIVGDLIRATPGTISLGQGVVSYGPPPQALERLRDFLADPQNHKYQPVMASGRCWNG